MKTFGEFLNEDKSKKAKRVFLGGTTNRSDWREKLIKKLEIEYFNPVVEDWDEKAQEQEIKERNNCDYCLYVITPKMIGVYSIAEVIDDSNKRPDKTILLILNKDGTKTFNEFQKKSLVQVGKMVEENGAKTFKNMKEVYEYLNK